MLDGSDVALMRLAYSADLNVPYPLPTGFDPFNNDGLGLPIMYGFKGFPYDGLSSGLFTNGEFGALATLGILNGVATATLAFRDASAIASSQAKLDHPEAGLGVLRDLITAFDAYVVRQHITQVAVTGHGLGGALAQAYMANHADTAAAQYRADTFGSSGATISATPDARITNVQIADDPAVYVGLHRSTIPAALAADPGLASAPLFIGESVYPGLAARDIRALSPAFTTDYVNRGTLTTLPNADGTFTTPSSLAAAAATNPAEPLATTYLARLESLTASLGNDQLAPAITQATTGSPIFRFFDTQNGSHFYTASATERAAIDASGSTLVDEGFSLNTVQAGDPAAAAIYRFFDTTNGYHFFTANLNERDALQAARPDLAYEGVAFDEHLTQQGNDAAVYRLFDTSNGVHFFTASQTEYVQILTTQPRFANEGIAFYTPRS